MSGPRRVDPRPPGSALAEPRLPASKSDLNRRLILAALAPGECRVGPGSSADDVTHLVRALSELGVPVEERPDGWTVGALDLDDPRPRTVWVGEGGTTSRFLAALASRRAGPTVLEGSPALGRRPVLPLLEALRQLGCQAEQLPGPRLVLRVAGPWRERRARVEVGDSSQFASALLLAAPEAGLELELLGAPVSLPYLALTGAALEAAGLTVERAGSVWRVRGPRRGPVQALRAAPDASSASYPLALGALLGGVRLPDWEGCLGQADAVFPQVLERMGARLEPEPGGALRLLPGALRGVELDATAAPDLVPAFAAVAAAARGPSRVVGAAHLRLKESDRLELLARGLSDFGVAARAEPDALWIGGAPARWTPAPRPALGGDHRLAMAFAVLGAAAAGVWIEEPGCVAKSWPEFWGWFDAP